jgi:hypothetical protein
MRTWVAIAVFCMSLLGGINGYGGVGMNQASGGEHASLKYYPDAVLSATDGATGVALSVEPDGRTLVARDRSGNTLWQTDVLAAAGKPGTGFPVIRSVAINAGKASLIVGKTMTVGVDLKTGSAAVLGEN